MKISVLVLFVMASIVLPFMCTFPEPVLSCAVMMIHESQEPGQQPGEPGQQQEPTQPADPVDPEGDGDPNTPPASEAPPTHVKPTLACTPKNRPDGKMPCMCLKQNPEGCSKGKRVAETATCNSWCWKDLCSCCRS